MKAPGPNNGEDLMSMLPDHILQLIISRLPSTEEAVRTSILSTRWRYLWTLVPSLDLDCTRAPKPFTDFKQNQFEEFVYSVLINKTDVDLESFRLCCDHYYDMSTVEEWIDAAVMRKVKRLDLRFCSDYGPDPFIDLPDSMFNYDALEVLKLFLYQNPVAWSFDTIFLPVLRVLEINSVLFSSVDLLENTLNSCPSLEDLALINCLSISVINLCVSCPNLKTLKIHCEVPDEKYDDEDDLLCKRLKICCPKLVFLEYVGQAAYQVICENLDSLKKAVIYPDDLAQKGISFESFSDNICQLAAAVSHVESLSLNLCFILAINAARVDFPASLGNLKTLDVSTTIDRYAMNFVFRILRCCPILESFHLTIQEEIIWLEIWELDEVLTRHLKRVWELDEVLTRHLKRVEFLEFNGEKWKLDMARFLLGHGNELEEMVFSWRDKVKYHEMSTKIMKELLQSDKASSTVKFITLFKD